MTAIRMQDCPDCPAPSRRHVALDDLSDAGRWVVAIVREWRRRIRARNELAALGERMLHDIGMTEAERAYLVNKPFWRE